MFQSQLLETNLQRRSSKEYLTELLTSLLFYNNETFSCKIVQAKFITHRLVQFVDN